MPPPTPPPSLPESPYLRVTFPHPGVCEVALTRPPVNALNTATWDALHALLIHLETHRFPSHTRALLLCSGLPPARGVFSAGLDLRELRRASHTHAAFHAVWAAASRALAALYRTPLHTVAALDGAAPAAGCALALACDARLATKRTRLGLDEVSNGVPVPASWAGLLIRAANSRPAAEAVLSSGVLLDAHAACRMHLVSRVVARHTHLRDAAMTLACTAADTGVACARARADTKIGVRAAFVKRWVGGVDAEARAAHAVVRVARDEARAKL